MATWRPEWLAFVPTFRSLSTQRDLSRRKGKEIWPGDCLSLDSTSTRRTTHSFPRTSTESFSTDRWRTREERKVSQSVSFHCLPIFTLPCYLLPYFLVWDHHLHDQSRWHLLISLVLWVVSSLRLWFLLSCSRYFYLFYLSALLLSQLNYPSRIIPVDSCYPQNVLLRAQKEEGRESHARWALNRTHLVLRFTKLLSSVN